MDSASRPSLKLVGLHVRKLGPLEQLDLPQNGLAWENVFPDVVLVGGPNGSGKTTLLDFLCFALLDQLQTQNGVTGWSIARETQAWLDVEICLTGLPRTTVRLLWGSEEFVSQHCKQRMYTARVRHTTSPEQYASRQSNHSLLQDLLQRFSTRTDIPAVLYIPTGDWPITTGGDADHSVGPLPAAEEFIYRWQAPTQWRTSTEGLLYALRWADLNAREEGQPSNHFKSYSEAFDQFFKGKKTLRWSSRGDLTVQLPGVRHRLSELSPGEKRILILLSELRYRWRPGSLVFIDEPELHLHTRWQLKLWDVLRQLRDERGGQLILTTQSSDLFEVADHHSTVLLGDGLR